MVHDCSDKIWLMGSCIEALLFKNSHVWTKKHYDYSLDENGCQQKKRLKKPIKMKLKEDDFYLDYKKDFHLAVFTESNQHYKRAYVIECLNPIVSNLPMTPCIIFIGMFEGEKKDQHLFELRWMSGYCCKYRGCEFRGESSTNLKQHMEECPMGRSPTNLYY